jgi:pilus assembly protein CpaF
MTCARWITCCALQSKIRVQLPFQAARELASQHAVLFWDVNSLHMLTAKTWEQLIPYRNAFSPALLRNFLKQGGASLSILQGIPTPDTPAKEIIALLKRCFEFIIADIKPSWDEPFLSLMDSTQALFLIAASDHKELESHLEQLARHNLPRALAHVIAPDLDARELAERLETETDLYCSRSEINADLTQQAKSRIHERLLDQTSAASGLPKEQTQTVLEKLVAEESALPVSREIREQVLTDLMHDVLGLGPLEPLLKDPEVTEVMVNGPETIFVEKKGLLHATAVRFTDESQLRTIIDRIVAPIGRRVDESTPLCDARLADGSRVNIVLPPLALDGPTLTIRKFMNKRLGLDDLVQFGALNVPMGEFLKHGVQARKNIVVSGGTGSGKTTLLNILSGFISARERIVTIEDAAELKLQQPHVVRLESRPANAEGQGAIPIRRLVMNALRMRPDRIVVGECRGGEAFDMLQAMNTGHDGSLTTLHANTPRDALGRLEALVLMAGIDLPIRAVREQIRSAVHFVVQIARLADGRRKVTSITEITGMEGDVLTTAELFRYRGGQFEATGLRSQRLEESTCD